METLELPKNQTLKQKQNNILKKRINYFDIAKGLGILLMIIGHMPIKNEYLKNFIFCFHMPLFFAISGATFAGSMLAKKDGQYLRYPTVVSLIKEKSKKLLILLSPEGRMIKSGSGFPEVSRQSATSCSSISVDDNLSLSIIEDIFRIARTSSSLPP